MKMRFGAGCLDRTDEERRLNAKTCPHATCSQWVQGCRLGLLWGNYLCLGVSWGN
ncbi:hypothetical protein C0J52_05191 [Blattella germanica]|nr:hypothetical protein C0J52_05191 [Blattella germanica]